MTLPDERLAQLLGETDLFAVLDDAERAEVAAASRVRRFHKGQFAFLEGDDATSLLVLVDGRLKLVVTSPSGDELLLRVLGPPAVVGEIGVLDGGPRSATVEVLDESEVLVVPATEVWRLIRNNNAFVEAMLLQLTALARTVTGTASDLVFLDLPRRVAKLLVGPRASASAALSGLSQSEIGKRVGASRQSVNAALRSFSRRNWIELSRQHVVVRNAAALERFASSP